MNPPATDDPIGELVALMLEGRVPAVVDRAWNLPAADVADVLAALPRAARSRLVGELPLALAAHALLELPGDAHPEVTIADGGPALAGRLLDSLELADAASLLARLPAADREPILAQVADREGLDRLLAVPAASAAAIMSSRLVAVSALDTMALATEAVRRQVGRTGELDTIFVIDSARRLRGILPIRQLFLASADALVRDVMIAPVVHVAPGEDQDVVARVIGRYGLSSVPVLDPAGRLLGRVSATDLHDVAIGDVGDDLLRFGGVSAADRAGTGWRAAVRNRLPWLYANLLPAFGGAAVIFLFQGALVRIAALAVWLPVIGGVSGNAGTQSLAVAVRRMVLEPRRREPVGAVVIREAIAGVVNGTALGVAVALVAILLGESWKLGLVVMLAMIGNLAIAGVAGGVAPLLLRGAGRAPTELPATTLTAVIDAVGFALLLALASTVLR